jgi:hypothetical protein
MNKFIYSVIGLVLLAGVVWLIMTPGKPGRYDDFAKCIAETKTVTFYGAFWCPHCQNQKSKFGKSAKYLPYVECSTPDGQGQLQICKDKIITTYPTWEFATSTMFASTTRITGVLELTDLAEKTACSLPE